MIDRLVVASKNPDKIAEIEAILREARLTWEIVTGLDWPDVEEAGTSLEENAILKARSVALATGLPALADDTGLEVAALGGGPGVNTARFAGPDATYGQNVAKLLAALSQVADRRASFRTVVAFGYPDGRTVIAEGRLEGRITLHPHGSSGFGYDPIFEVDGRTLAEIDPVEKNRLSHRAKAISALVEVLGGQKV